MAKNYSHKLSIVIVNYNVEYFLEQCLNSVLAATRNIETQIWVVDNNSIDGSVEMIRRKFPMIELIENKSNAGFSKANNQAIQQSNAEYVLLLNPDTVIEEDTLEKCIDFLDATEDAGGLGVRMLDGKGRFLPESKRGLPTPAVAFYKIFGLSRLFPKSKRFGQYHLGHLSEHETNPIDVLSGAFMLMRSEALDKVGLLDETFFMYGEDIDLSYRIQQGGYQNYYFPKTSIIHYKGESTKKSSVNYVFVFYKAMIIFAQKHFSQKNAKLFSFFIHLAIYFRATIAVLSRLIKKLTLPFCDFALIALGLLALTNQWKIENIDFPEEILNYAIPGYTSIWFTSILFNRGYDKPIRLFRYVSGTLIGTLVILVIYALLPKAWQFSRLFILLGACWIIVYYLTSRVFIHFSIGGTFNLKKNKNKKFAIVGSKEEFLRVKEIVHQTHLKIESIEHVSLLDTKESGAIGTINQLDQIAHINQIDELIFCARDTSAQNIIYWMSRIDSDTIDFKIAQPESLSLIGSNSIDTAGDLYVLDINSISKTEKIRSKRTFDLFFGSVLFMLTPIGFLVFSSMKNYMRNILSVIGGKRSIVGYDLRNESLSKELPRIKTGILYPTEGKSNLDENQKAKLNLIYARDYSVKKDILILFKGWKNLDR